MLTANVPPANSDSRYPPACLPACRRLMASIFQTPVALITLITEDLVWFKASAPRRPVHRTALCSAPHRARLICLPAVAPSCRCRWRTPCLCLFLNFPCFRPPGPPFATCRARWDPSARSSIGRAAGATTSACQTRPKVGAPARPAPPRCRCRCRQPGCLQPCSCHRRSPLLPDVLPCPDAALMRCLGGKSGGNCRSRRFSPR